MKEQTISNATIDRLPRYFGALRAAKENGMEIVSSECLGRQLGIQPEQIRKDLAGFGQFGKRGVGYFAGALSDTLGKIMGLDKGYRVAIVGIGHLGVALTNYQNFDKLGFKFVALIDNNPDIIGLPIHGMKVESSDNLETVIKEKKVDIGIIAVPASEAQSVANRLILAGVRGIWNFAPTRLSVSPKIPIVNEDLSVGLSRLSYRMSN